MSGCYLFFSVKGKDILIRDGSSAMNHHRINPDDILDPDKEGVKTSETPTPESREENPVAGAHGFPDAGKFCFRDTASGKFCNLKSGTSSSFLLG